jgi:hypothetical protein
LTERVHDGDTVVIVVDAVNPQSDLRDPVGLRW